MMQVWSDYIEQLRNSKPAKVLKMRAADFK